MFGLFRKKSDNAREKLLTLIATSSGMINIQLMLSSPSESQMLEDYVRGYIFGFFDSTFAAARLQLNDEEFLAAMLLAHEVGEITGIADGGAYLIESIHRQSAPGFQDGQKAGGTDHHNFMRDGKTIPTKLSGYLMGSD